MAQGWISLHRKIQKHWLFDEKRKFSKFEAWVDMLMMANHKPNKFLLGNELIELKEGQFVTSELKLMERWDWGKNKLRLFLDLLEKDGMIVKKSDRKKTTITICNYKDYQTSDFKNGPQADHKRTDNGLITDTNNNVNNVNNENKLVSSISPVNVIHFYENNFGPIRPFVSESIDKWIDDLGEELVVEALKVALKDQKNFSYAEGVMRNWASKNYKTINDVEADKKQHERSKEVKNSGSIAESITRNQSDLGQYDFGNNKRKV